LAAASDESATVGSGPDVAALLPGAGEFMAELVSPGFVALGGALSLDIEDEDDGEVSFCALCSLLQPTRARQAIAVVASSSFRIMVNPS
jgi:hypothetical protein